MPLLEALRLRLKDIGVEQREPLVRTRVAPASPRPSSSALR